MLDKIKLTSNFTEYARTNPEFRIYAWAKLTQQMCMENYPLVVPRGYSVVEAEHDVFTDPAQVAALINQYLHNSY